MCRVDIPHQGSIMNLLTDVPSHVSLSSQSYRHLVTHYFYVKEIEMGWNWSEMG